MPRVDNSAHEPLNLKSNNKFKLVFPNKLSVISLEHYLFTVFILLAVLLAFAYLKLPYLKSSAFKSEEATTLKTAYSGVSVEEGSIYFLNRHEARRRRSASRTAKHEGVRGLALDCGNSCYFRLRQNSTKTAEPTLRIHLFRWRQVPVPHNKSLRTYRNDEIRPLVVFLDSNDTMHARISHFAPDCIYSAHVSGAEESSIVNLCDTHGGLFGTLALLDGTYIIEPIEGHRHKNNVLSHKAHLVYKSRSLSFHSYDYSGLNNLLDKFNKSSTDVVNYINETNNIFGENLTEDFIGINARGTRSRRSANSWDHYVEVLVVADYHMALYHQNSLENYILTLFSTVASIYRHPSLNAAINIVVVKILILKQRMPEFEGDSARDILLSFCKWQKHFNDPDEDSPNHYDVAILLTRNDICRSRNKCDTLGLAELGTMCKPEQSCAIIEDNGLSAGFTITHELGHVFNIPHDDESKCTHFMQKDPTNFHIMAPTLEYNTHPWSWSPCSSAMLAEFLDTKRAQTQCLLDQPAERRYYERLFEMPAPGAMFSADQQCKFVFGSHSGLCKFTSLHYCERLWCEDYIRDIHGAREGCRTQHMPWADGTPCGKDQWCHHGKCVGLAPQQREKQDGGWGQWKQWEECSRTCGGGVQKAYRECDNPKPSHGGRYCVGQRERYRSCNSVDCPLDTPGFRELQCSAFDYTNTGIHGASRNAKWIPKYEGVSLNERCKLYCHEEGRSAFFLMKGKVIDGTPCDRKSDDICIDGTCHKAGCDHRLGSELRRDMCGVCGGDNSSCRLVSGRYNEHGQYGYTEVVKIPAGSSAIEITQHAYQSQREDDNYLALRNSNNEFILNGNYQVSVYPVQITVQNAVLWYSGSDNVEEKINASGPIWSDIYVHVLSVGRLYPPDIRYKFMVPLDVNDPHYRKNNENYYWRVSDAWTECSSPCQGKQSQIVICISAVTGQAVQKELCSSFEPNVQTRLCNLDCVIKWRTVIIGSCTVTCGHGEIRQRSECIRQYNDGREEAVAESECRHLHKPSDRKVCYHDCAGRKWTYSNWSQCSETCGTGGTTYRQAFCVDQKNRTIDEKLCEREAKEITEKECNRVPCPKWVYTTWSECSRSCDGGIRVRHAVCQDAAGREISARMCNIKEKHDREPCNKQVCTRWQFGNWSACSVTCGDGIQSRNAVCVDRNGRHLDPGHCNARQKHVQKQCHRPACPSWRLGSWSSCTVTCLDGLRSRSVTCVNHNGVEVDSSYCTANGETRPPSHEPCNLGPCPFWRASDWSQCSVSCGSGTRSRHVECIYNNQVVDNSLCNEQGLMKTEEVCHLFPCAQWKALAWNPCSVTCGTGVQKRIVQCVREMKSGAKNIAHAFECDPASKPHTERVCEKPACKVFFNNYGRWETGEWSNCSASCGNGRQRRQVKCRFGEKDVSDDYCSNSIKPVEVQNCRIKPCVKWVVGPWKPCPVTCGSEKINTERTVNCQSIDLSEIVNESDCNAITKPNSVRSCNLKPCSFKMSAIFAAGPGRWITGNWEKCSTTCGPGWKRRRVSCTGGSCDEKLRPKIYEPCNLQECPLRSNLTLWSSSSWSKCSKTCGGGVQHREVWCEDAKSRSRLRDSNCSGMKKPAFTQLCGTVPCRSSHPGRYQWHAGQWTPCSRTCGRGKRVRKVFCQDFSGNKVDMNLCIGLKMPNNTDICRIDHCPKWRRGKWSSCSATCGKGIKTRKVVCTKGRRHILPNAECSALLKPASTAKCEAAACPTYHWTIKRWSKCRDPCKKSTQHREVFCSSSFGKRAAEKMCEHLKKPESVRNCSTARCPYHWVPGSWTSCTVTCGEGFHYRGIKCRIKNGGKVNDKMIEAEASVHQDLCLGLPKPPIRKKCAVKPCSYEYRWGTGKWSNCSKQCGPGIRKRKVVCLNKEGVEVDTKLCDKGRDRPRRRESCFIRNCIPSDCADLKLHNKAKRDGVYTVLVDGFMIRVYCHMMNGSLPKTYIEVNHTTNFAEFYNKRLDEPYTCPYNGKRNDSCSCHRDTSGNAGFTRYSKIRVDLHNMKININDDTFGKTLSGVKIAYGTAGDCYSTVKCPQGRFEIDLRNTGLRIADKVAWTAKGLHSSSEITRFANNARIVGRCGGYCSKCYPSIPNGLQIEVDRRQLYRNSDNG